ncbi:synaptophysin-like [Dendronephthya gigantea]|uniref:synaptophysin-like n=1 Tax=Dendronephthya gigantea TaxID=151771 RepID=UPI00106BBF10|nr:synaptophysin-like [Dendronephthya gigantea]
MPVHTNFNRFKEPRGFIKVIQFVIAILAFSTTAGYNGEGTATISVHGTKCEVKGEFSYSFDKIDVSYACEGSTNTTKKEEDLSSVLKSSSEFFVFVGVVTFLYCIVAMVYYVCFEDPAKYGPGGTGRDIMSFATVDLAITIILTLFWFCGSTAWASGVQKLKDETDIEDQCDDCKVTDKPNYAGLIISVLFGFLCFFLWGANIWFVFKETIWHKEPEATITAEKPQVEIPRQEVPGEAVP